MKEEKTEIKKLVLEIGGKEMTVSVEDAKKLHEALSELFGKTKSETVYWPIYRDRYIERPWRYWEPMYYATSKLGGLSQQYIGQSTNTLKMSLDAK